MPEYARLNAIELAQVCFTAPEKPVYDNLTEKQPVYTNWLFRIEMDN
ncbi:hypothetical protein SALWKB12_0967 [Snodgrassella communis]|uniref:Uncharacterized protein n=1 Tax=Snodgrassella communis TaxID=2946699 RepID=A0A837B134_9NEIS|nr:hypothetical protein SALWKB12_0967 [Snodgrassella communis]KDN15566.1 hypothetical protein SALWKB29_0670 [Snodgrassella communis]